MDSINALKGYNRVGELDNRTSLQKTGKRLIIFISSAIILTIFIISAICTTFISPAHHHNNTLDDEISPSTATSNSIKAVCKVTRYPNSCISSFSSSNSFPNSNKPTDPEQLFKLSLQVSMNELSKLSSFPEQLIAKVNDKGAQTALRDCKNLIQAAIDQVNKSVQCMQVGKGGEKMLNESKINDIRTWLSAAITNQETCLDGLEEMKGRNKVNVGEEMKAAMKNSMEFTSNSLAIVSNIQTILGALHVTLHRKLMWLREEAMNFGDTA